MKLFWPFSTFPYFLHPSTGACPINNSQASIRTAISCRSGKDIKLSEIQQQLEVADTKCGSLKSQLDYMKLLYYGVQPETDGNNKTVEINPTAKNSSSLKLSPESNTNSQIIANFEESEDVKYYAFLREIRKIQETTGNERDKQTPRESPRLTVRLPEIVADSADIHDSDARDPVDSSNEVVIDDARYSPDDSFHARFFAQTSTPEEAKSKFIQPGRSFTHLFVETFKEFYDRQVYDEHRADATTRQHPYQKYLAEYSADLQRDILRLHTSDERDETAERNVAERKSETADGVNCDDRETTLRVARSDESARGNKREKFSRIDRKQKTIASSAASKKNPACRAEEVNGGKIKRKKTRLRSSTSRSTVATKDTNFTSRRDVKRRKQKNSSFYSRAIRDRPAPQDRRNRSEVVEIFHNAELRSDSVSVVSSKQAVPCPRANDTGEEPFPPDDRKKGCSPIDQRRVRRHSPDEFQCQKGVEVAREIRSAAQNTTEKRIPTVSNSVPANCQIADNKVHSYHQPSPDASSYDPMTIRNYELPTLASKLKRSNRSYFNRFNFRNIPFVVGTSITPSHNLGLNIQQVLSIMKTRQPAVSGIAPLLIRKVSKGMRPVSVLMEFNEQSTKLSRDADYRTHDTNQETNVYSNEAGGQIQDIVSLKLRKQLPSMQSLRSAQNSISQYARDKKQNSLEETGIETKALDPCADKDQPSNSRVCLSQQRSTTRTKSAKGFTCESAARHDGNPSKGDSRNGDCRYASSHAAHNSRGIREVLVNLHDQFEEMNTRYEKLQEKAEKSGDKALTDEISALEKELNAKEDEINAVVDLYKEVMALKQQMKMLRERNSFVCISTEVPGLTKTDSSLPLNTPVTAGFRPVGHFHPVTPRRRNAFAAGREPSTSIRLAGLLRQIQTFQKQLQST